MPKPSLKHTCASPGFLARIVAVAVGKGTKRDFYKKVVTPWDRAHNVHKEQNCLTRPEAKPETEHSGCYFLYSGSRGSVSIAVLSLGVLLRALMCYVISQV